MMKRVIVDIENSANYLDLSTILFWQPIVHLLGMFTMK